MAIIKTVLIRAVLFLPYFLACGVDAIIRLLHAALAYAAARFEEEIMTWFAQKWEA